MARRIVWLTILAVLAASLVGGRTLVANVALAGHYIVKPGETLSQVAARLGVSVNQLAALNGIEDPNAILAGQALRLPAEIPRPVGSTATQPSRAVGGEYVVRHGESLSSIALAFGTTVRELIDANQLLDPDRLVVGQHLKVPAGVVASAPTQRAATIPADHSTAALLERLAARYGVDPTLVKAMAWLAGGGKPAALGGVQSLGLLHVAPATFEYVARTLLRRDLDVGNVEDQVEAGVAYLAAMLRWAGEGGESRALAGYIQGPGSVQVAGARPSTEQQVQAVLALRAQLRGSARVATPAPAGGLAERVAAAVRATGASGVRVGVAGRDLVSGQRIALLASESFPAASVAKLWILTELYRQHHAGVRPLSDQVRAELQMMILVSDNDAANRLMELVGVRSVNGTMAAMGLAGTRLANQFGAARLNSGLINQTTPADMVRWLELLAADELISPAISREIRALLFQAGDASKLRRGLPPEAQLAHKSGWFGGVANDVGLVYHGPSAYILAVFTDGIPDPDAANDTIAAIARVVHASWGQR